jgi:phosphatidylserine decarboxylase
MLRFHREGYRIIGITLLISIGIISLAAYFFNLIVFGFIFAITGSITVMILRFFRSPSRKIESSESIVLAPADGKVVSIEKIYESEYLKKECTLISIFMSIYNVHVNRYPIAGSVKFYKYHPGKYLVARHPKSSELNERTTVLIGSDSHEILVRQIAGYVARRIVCYAKVNTRVNQQDEMGFIKFGSRVDIYLPLEAEINVYLNQKTVGGLTQIAKLK